MHLVCVISLEENHRCIADIIHFGTSTQHVAQVFAIRPD